MILYVLLSKRICMAIGFAAFTCDNTIRRKHMQIFVKKGQTHKILAHWVKTRIFNANLLHMSSVWRNQMENDKKL